MPFAFLKSDYTLMIKKLNLSCACHEGIQGSGDIDLIILNLHTLMGRLV
jgi:hypothetical protein